MADTSRGSETKDQPVWSDTLVESLARAIHSAYLEAGDAQEAIRTDPSMVPWDELPGALRESSRDQAAHIRHKLDAIGCDVRPAGDEAGDDQFRLEPDEVEFLAELEHRRWVHERLRNGWVQGPRDPMKRTTPYLVPWEELSERMRDYDRLFVRLMPELLREQGYRIVRRAPERSERNLT